MLKNKALKTELTEHEVAFNTMTQAIELAQRKGCYTLVESSAILQSIIKVKEKIVEVK